MSPVGQYWGWTADFPKTWQSMALVHSAPYKDKQQATTLSATPTKLQIHETETAPGKKYKILDDSCEQLNNIMWSFSFWKEAV